MCDIIQETIESLPSEWMGYAGSAVYFLLENRVVVYVGESQRLNNRLFTHVFRNNIRSGRCEVRFHECDPVHRKKVERAWIVALKPRDNCRFARKIQRGPTVQPKKYALKRKCRRGHILKGHVYDRKDGTRECRKCSLLRNRLWREKKKK
jgi:hypothetical protein